ncbi:MAG: hypothetical protein JRH11_08405 [Deltaproteobacteria bacterium]|nr:hypothetical protein [Deltaproteobacteria bacterium]
MKPAKDAIVAGGVSGLAAGTCLFLAVTLAVGTRVVPVASLLAVGLLGVAVVAAWVAPGRLGAGIAGGLGATAPMVWLGSMAWMTQPVVASHWRCGTGDVGFFMIGIPLFILAAVGGGVVMTLAAGRGLRLIAAAGAVAGLTTLVVLVPGGLARTGNPESAAWVETLPELGVLPAVTTIEGRTWCTEGTGPRPGANCPPGYECATSRCQRRDEVHIAGRTLSRSCTPEGFCQVSFETPADGSPSFGEPVQLESRSPVLVRHDKEHDLWLVGEPFNIIALDGATGDVVDVEIRRIADSLAPPRGWVIAGVGGLTLALLALLLAAVAWGRARIARGARAGRADAYGSIAFDDGQSPARGMSASPTAEGPVLATARGRHRPPSYRTVEGPASWKAVSGERIAIVQRYESRVNAWLNVALSAAWLTAAPLIAASLGGLIG